MTASGSRSFDVLRELARQRGPTDGCGLCGAALARRSHEHVLEVRSRRIVCACLPCACLFGADGPREYKRIPRRVERLQDFDVSDADWDSLCVPIGLAFFVRQEGHRFSAVYPSPAGPVESLLPLQEWDRVFQRNAAVAGMQPDIEALLVNRTSHEYFVAPIDECYRLTGLIRVSWKGLSGGADVFREVQSFFGDLRRRSRQEIVDA